MVVHNPFFIHRFFATVSRAPPNHTAWGCADMAPRNLPHGTGTGDRIDRTYAETGPELDRALLGGVSRPEQLIDAQQPAPYPLTSQR